MHFDIWTILASEVAVCLLMATVLLLTGLQFRTVSGPRHLGFGFLGAALGIAVFLLRGVIPMAINVPLSNALYCASNALFYVGIAALLQVKAPLRHLMVIAALSTAALVYFRATDQTVLRLVIITVTDLLFRISLLIILLRSHQRSVVKPLTMCVALFLMADVVRAAATLHFGTSAHVFQYSVVQSSYITASLLLNCAFGVFSLALIAQEVVESVELRARHDSLTRVMNRLGIEERLHAEIERMQNIAASFSVALLDVDRFKVFNDFDGHAAGDDVLRRVAFAISHELQPEHACGRLGGDEFLVLLPGETVPQAREVCQRIAAALSIGEPYPVSGAVPTVSIGVTDVVRQDSKKDILGRADKALYSAKRLGRNRIHVEMAHMKGASSERNIRTSTARRSLRS